MIETKSAKWRPGYRNRVKAEIALVEIEKLEAARGIVTPRAVVDLARRKRNPLHPQFEWDDSVAAERHREQQARQMLANLVTVSIIAGEEVREAPVYVSVHSPEHDGQRGYMRVTKVVLNEDLRQEALEETQRMIRGLRRRFSALTGLVQLLEQFEDEVREALAS
jgi:hypothetical protein